MSHNTQPVFGAQGSTWKVVGSAIIKKSAPPCICGMPKPPPAVNTGNTLRCEVSLARSVVVMVQPLRITRAASAAIICLPRRMPCWSGNDRRTTASRAKAALYRPDAGPTPHVGVLVMHRTSNYLTHRACTELSRRGFLMLCMNTRYENNEALVDFEKLPLDVKTGVEILRRQAGITKVVLFAHSGGGPLMALYQAVAEEGPAFCKGATK